MKLVETKYPRNSKQFSLVVSASKLNQYSRRHGIVILHASELTSTLFQETDSWLAVEQKLKLFLRPFLIHGNADVSIAVYSSNSGAILKQKTPIRITANCKIILLLHFSKTRISSWKLDMNNDSHGEWTDGYFCRLVYSATKTVLPKTKFIGLYEKQGKRRTTKWNQK